MKPGGNIDFLIPSSPQAKEGAKLTGGGPPSQRTPRLEWDYSGSSKQRVAGCSGRQIGHTKGAAARRARAFAYAQVSDVASSDGAEAEVPRRARGRRALHYQPEHQPRHRRHWLGEQNAERDTGWKFKGDARTPTDEELTALMVPLVRARPKFARFKELAAAAGSPASAEPSANTPAADHSGMGS